MGAALDLQRHGSLLSVPRGLGLRSTRLHRPRTRPCSALALSEAARPGWSGATSAPVSHLMNVIGILLGCFGTVLINIGNNLQALGMADDAEGAHATARRRRAAA